MLEKYKSILCLTTLLATVASSAFAAPAPAPRLVTAAVDDSKVVVLAGNHAGAIAAAKDEGAVQDSLTLPHAMLILQRPAAAQAALDELVRRQQIRGDAAYHHWLKPADLRAYGPAQADIDTVVVWLRSHGLTVNGVSPSGMSIDIGGTAAQLAAAFRTPLHHFTLHGESHLANTQDAAIPAALAPIVRGVTLSNFFPKSNAVPAGPNFTIPVSGRPSFYAVAPNDFNIIYNVLPARFNSATGGGLVGNGVTIAVIEQTNIQAKDWNRFRDYFELGRTPGQFRPLHPGHCADPGYTQDEVEAAIDAEWAGVAAPAATIVEASCAGTPLTFGVETALQNLVEGTAAGAGTGATIYSISYGGCEQEDGLAFLDGWSNLTKEGSAEGITILVSAGDSGSSCDEGATDAKGLGVNGLAANPDVTSVGGTDFYDTAQGQTKSYWNHTNGAPPEYGVGSVKSYVPEIPWDNSCANSIVAGYFGNMTGIAFCNSDVPALSATQDGIGGTGGASLYYPKPLWQSTAIPGVPNDGVRDQPDVAFFAGNGLWAHAYLICMSDESEGGSPCKYSGSFGSVPNALRQAYGGTSVAAPAFAGILALETELTNGPLGNVNPRLYQLAQLQFSNPVLINTCSATLGNAISKACVFNNVTAGDNAEPCGIGTPDCFVSGVANPNYGVLGTKLGTTVTNAYPAGPGYSLATGLGSLNAYNLLLNY